MSLSASNQYERRPSIIICGDIMLDHNIFTNVEKIANEAPIPVFNHNNETFLLGGCGNVLKNVHALGCSNLFLFTVVGNDSAGERIQKTVNIMGVNNHIKVISEFNTTIKQRFYCDNKIIFRCDTENASSIRHNLTTHSFASEIETVLQSYKIDCIILSDYNKGVLYDEQCKIIISLAKKYGALICVDPKINIDKYAGCTLIKPNRKEAFELAGLNNTCSIETLHRKIQTITDCSYSVITLAEKGITLFDGTMLLHEIAHSHAIVDVTGAGDIVCAVLGYLLGQGCTDLRMMIQIATRIATKSTESAGTYTLERHDIFDSVKQLPKCISLTDIPTLKHKYSDKKIVFTNGCFDLLHSGHVQLFKACNTLGDIVVVGLNSDSSIRRLKGASRPVNNLETRLEILGSIQYIDHIIVFEEDTPLAILSELRPDVLVKGGDYAPETIVGREFAMKTVVCDFKQGCSSTLTIQQIIKDAQP